MWWNHVVEPVPPSGRTFHMVEPVRHVGRTRWGPRGGPALRALRSLGLRGGGRERTWVAGRATARASVQTAGGGRGEGGEANKTANKSGGAGTCAPSLEGRSAVVKQRSWTSACYQDKEEPIGRGDDTVVLGSQQRWSKQRPHIIPSSMRGHFATSATKAAVKQGALATDAAQRRRGVSTPQAHPVGQTSGQKRGRDRTNKQTRPHGDPTVESGRGKRGTGRGRGPPAAQYWVEAHLTPAERPVPPQ